MSDVGECFYFLSIAYIFTVKLLVDLFLRTSSTLAYNVYQALCKEMFTWGHDCCRNIMMLFLLSFISYIVGMVFADLRRN
jgi:hypothetical protein